MKTNSILEKAKALNGNKAQLSDDAYEACVACAKGEISPNALIKAMGKSAGAVVYVLLFKAFKRYVSENPKK